MCHLQLTTWYCALKNALDLMLSILTTHTHKTKGHKETCGGHAFVYYHDCGDGIMGVGICPNSSKCIHYICAVLCVSIL